MVPWSQYRLLVVFIASNRLSTVKGHQAKLAIEQSVQDGFNLHFKSIAKEDVDTVLNTMCNSFNVCSVLIQKSKKDPGDVV